MTRKHVKTHAQLQAEKKALEVRALTVEQDYLLIALHDAISTQNEAEAAKYTARLREIHTELEALK